MSPSSPARRARFNPGVVAAAVVLLLLLAFLLISLVRGAANAYSLDASYGHSAGSSVNGTGVLAKLLENQGHQVRTAWNLTVDLAQWADVIIRVAYAPGPPSVDEADWYDQWLDDQPRHALVYVVRDYDAQVDYWKRVLDQLAGAHETARRDQAEVYLAKAQGWASQLPPREQHLADPDVWFAVSPAVNPPRQCKTLGGPWADEIDAPGAGLTIHEPLKAHEEDVLLTGDGDVLAMDWEVEHGGRVLAIANGSFLLNLPLAIPARRPLAGHVLEWIGGQRRHVAFVEGPMVELGQEETPTLFELVARIRSFRWVAIHFGLLGLLACLARAPRLGRPIPEPASDADRPAAHAEAVGTLLERTRSAALARDLLETYRRWRFARMPQDPGRMGPSRVKKP